MQTHEKWAVWLIAGTLASSIYALAIAILAAGSHESHPWWGFDLVAGKLVNLVVAAWLFVTARRDGNSGWVWGAVGLVFSLIAAVLYFVLRALERPSALPGEGPLPSTALQLPAAAPAPRSW